MSQGTTKRLLGSLKTRPNIVAPVGSNMILPNNSGDHRKSIKRNAPVGDQDLVNKEYVDDQDGTNLQDAKDYADAGDATTLSDAQDYTDDNTFWDRTGTTLTPKTANDNLQIDGNVGIGIAPTTSLLLISKTLDDGYSGINLTPSFGANTGGYALAGFAIANTGNWIIPKLIVGLDYGVFSTFQSVTGNNLSTTGANLFGYGMYGGTANMKDITALNIENLRVLAGTFTADNVRGIRIKNPTTSGASTITNLTQLEIEKPTKGTNNYQLKLLGNGTGSGIWFDGAERIYSDGTNLCSAAPFKAVGGLKSSDGSTGITATITTAALTPGGSTGSMTFKNGILTAQTAAT